MLHTDDDESDGEQQLIDNDNDDYSEDNNNDDNHAESNINNEDIVDDLKYDVFNLVACNHHTIRLDIDNGEDIEDAIVLTTQRATQLLLKK